MLGDSRAASRRDNRGRGGNVERGKTVSYSSARVDQALRAGVTVRKNMCGVATHDAGKAGKLLDENGPLVKRKQQTHDPRGVHASAEQLFHQAFRIGARKG